MMKNRISPSCRAMRCDATGWWLAVPCFSQIQGSSRVSVCVWFMRKIEGPKEVGGCRALREKGIGRWMGIRVVAGPSGLISAGLVDCWMTYRLDTLHQAVVKPRRSGGGGGGGDPPVVGGSVAGLE